MSQTILILSQTILSVIVGKISADAKTAEQNTLLVLNDNFNDGQVISARGDCVGGIVGYAFLGNLGTPTAEFAEASLIRNCSNRGAVKAEGRFVGGTAGLLYQRRGNTEAGLSFTESERSLTINRCANLGTVDAHIPLPAQTYQGYTPENGTVDNWWAKSAGSIYRYQGVGGVLGMNYVTQIQLATDTTKRFNFTVSDCANGNSDLYPDGGDPNVFVRDNGIVSEEASFSGAIVGSTVSYLANDVNLLIDNCKNVGSIDGCRATGSAEGGIVGLVYGNLSTDNDINHAADFVVQNCINNGAMTGPAGANIGGIAGFCMGRSCAYTNGSQSPITASIVNCVNNGTITLNSSSLAGIETGIGGIAGRLFGNNGSASNHSRFSANVSNTTNNGQILCALDGAVTPKTKHFNVSAGGICGDNYSVSSTFENCTNNGPVEIQIKNDYVFAAVGGIIGHAYQKYVVNTNILLSQCMNKAPVKANGSTPAASEGELRLGGVLGYVGVAQVGTTSKFDISKCVNTGDISSTFNSKSQVGGLLGTSYSASATKIVCLISDSYTTGLLSGRGTGAKYFGGIIGNIRPAVAASVDVYCATNSYSSGKISVSGGTSSVGGIYGNNERPSTTPSVAHCYYLKDSYVPYFGVGNLTTDEPQACKAKTLEDFRDEALLNELKAQAAVPTTWKANTADDDALGIGIGFNFPVLDWQ